MHRTVNQRIRPVQEEIAPSISGLACGDEALSTPARRLQVLTLLPTDPFNTSHVASSPCKLGNDAILVPN